MYVYKAIADWINKNKNILKLNGLEIDSPIQIEIFTETKFQVKYPTQK